MRFTSLKQDHRLTLMLPHYHQLHRFTWVLPIDLFQLPEVNKFVHSAKALTPHLRVMLLRTQKNAPTSPVKRHSASIVWVITKYLPVIPSIDVTFANVSITQPQQSTSQN